MVNTDKIRRSFSQAAATYEDNALLQRQIGRSFLKKIKDDQGLRPSRILDVGCGTGNFTEELASLFNARVWGIDNAWGMVISSRKKGIIAFQADAEDLPFKNKSFDFVVSNLSYQWVRDLDRAFSQCARVLCLGGKFYFSCFARDTLRELRSSLNHALAGKSPLFPLPDEEEIKLNLEKNRFKVEFFQARELVQEFKDIFSLIRWLKLIGANRVSKPIFIKRDEFLRADEFYRKNFKSNGNIFATFHLIEVKALK